MKSKKTTLTAITALIAAIAAAVHTGATDGIEAIQWEPLVALIVAAVGLWFARDNDVTDKESGAEEAHNKRVRKKLKSGFLPIAVFGALSVAALSACTTTTPLMQSYQVRVAYVGTMEALVELREAGMIDDDAYRKIDQYRLAAKEAIGEMEQAALEGRVSDFERYRAAAQKAVDRLIELRIKEEESHGSLGNSRNYERWPDARWQGWTAGRNLAA